MLGNDSSDNIGIMLGNPKRALIKMSIPLIVSLLITSFYNLIDAAWVSGLGADALAGSDDVVVAVGGDNDGVDVATLAAAHLLDGAAHWRYNLDGLIILVVIEGFACSYMLALFLLHAGNDPVEVIGNDRHTGGTGCIDNGVVGDGAQQVDVEPFLESYSCHVCTIIV